MRGHTGPFAQASVGLGYVSVGDDHVRSLTSSGLEAEASAGRNKVFPAFGLAAGFRRLPGTGRLAPHAGVRYLLLPGKRDGVHIVSVALGFGL